MVAEVGVRQGLVPANIQEDRLREETSNSPPKGTLHLPPCGVSHQGPSLWPGPAFLPWAFPVDKQER